MTELSRVMAWKYIGYRWSCISDGATYDDIIWVDENTPKPSKDQISQDIIDYEKHVADTDYLKKRKGEMPSSEVQLEMIYNDKINNTTTWVDTITALHQKYPPPK